MKKITIIMIFAVTSLLIAGPTETVLVTKDISQIEAAYVVDLTHTNHGIVESALYCIIKMKAQIPDQDFVRISRVINRLARTGDTPVIRYKANLAKLFMEDPALTKCLSAENMKECQDGPEFWTALVANVPFAYDV